VKKYTLSLTTFLAVLTANFSLAEGLKDIKPPVKFPADYSVIFLVLGIIVVILLISISLWFLKKRYKNQPEKKQTYIKPAHEIAYEAFKSLEERNLLKAGKIKEFYFELSNIIRYYLENRFSYRAPEMTTEEFLNLLKESSRLNDSQKNILKTFLTHCDLVKFAKYGPTDIEIAQSLSIGKELIDQTKLRQGKD